MIYVLVIFLLFAIGIVGSIWEPKWEVWKQKQKQKKKLSIGKQILIFVASLVVMLVVGISVLLIIV